MPFLKDLKRPVQEKRVSMSSEKSDRLPVWRSVPGWSTQLPGWSTQVPGWSTQIMVDEISPSAIGFMKFHPLGLKFRH